MACIVINYITGIEINLFSKQTWGEGRREHPFGGQKSSPCIWGEDAWEWETLLSPIT
jgi:hypothetical protein